MGIFLVCSAVLKAGDQAILESPNYEPLYRCAQHAGAEIKMLERRFERGFQFDLEELERMVGRSTRAILLSNTHNPSGAATSPEKLQTAGQIARDYGATVISAEVYLDNAFTPGLRPAASLGPNLVSIGSLSKVYGLGGLRIGWIVAGEPVLRRARQILDYLECELPAPSLRIAATALRKAPELVLRCQQIATRNLKVVSEWVARRGDVQWIEPQGGTVAMVRLPAGVDSQVLAKLLQEKFSTLVVPGEFFYTRGQVRISYGMDEEILRQGLKNVSKAIDQLKARRP
jgi:aspartate/methionine/tyrosine aminotransferase